MKEQKKFNCDINTKILEQGDFYEEDINITVTEKNFIENRKQYNGNIEDDKFHGEGKLIYHNSDDFFNGTWHEGKFKIGLGKFTFKDNVSYDGQWQNNAAQGQGKLTYANGDYLNGIWNQGKFIRGKKKNESTEDIKKREDKNNM